MILYHLSNKLFTEFDDEFSSSRGDFPTNGFYFSTIENIKSVWSKIRPNAKYLYECKIQYKEKLFFEDKVKSENDSFFEAMSNDAIYIDETNGNVLQSFTKKAKNIKIINVTEI